MKEENERSETFGHLSNRIELKYLHLFKDDKKKKKKKNLKTKVKKTNLPVFDKTCLQEKPRSIYLSIYL